MRDCTRFSARRLPGGDLIDLPGRLATGVILLPVNIEIGNFAANFQDPLADGGPCFCLGTSLLPTQP
ncbi:hypothetical protein EMEDMD4_230021 [Sinorhizobium medicae]|uniref:Uncharacterized protein n=1 Tax=Sinorhizobium medicae TaxID=110321 RepID=A0A508WU11_9HYPH|nr:hypothetical protein EMEDMD4_230021 [Sinorhizobium medicae]